jgi:hypothetical protein
MAFRGILFSVYLVAALACLSTAASGAQTYFDINGDGLPDTECLIGLGEELLVGVYLSDFAEETGSFQFDIYYDDAVLTLIDYDTYVGQADEDPGLTGPIQTLAELGPWATSQWSEPVTQELNAPDGGSGARLEFYTAGSFTETATGDGVLAWLVFDATTIGETTLDLQMPGGTWFLEAVAEQPTPINLTVTVVPEPSVVLLVVTLSLVLGGRPRLGSSRSCVKPVWWSTGIAD